MFQIIDGPKAKIFSSEDYNFFFDKTTGLFMRWGKTQEDNPQVGPSPEILDIEITTKCSGGCSFCYKGNTPDGVNMSFETFKTVLDKMPPTLTQVAFGADYDCSSNPDLWKMMEYCREKGIIPNITVAKATEKTADLLAKFCGAVAVSRYANKNICYDTVKRLTDRRINQTNIHVMVSEESFIGVKETLEDMTTDARLKAMNAIVLLALKKKGRGINHTSLPQDKFSSLINFALENKLKFGMDSCSAHKFLHSMEGNKDYKSFEQVVEPCEATLFSSYVNVHGDYFPCSFTPHTLGWNTGISVITCRDFVKDIWNNVKTKTFRDCLLNKCRNCPIYDI